ncbi:hypothetical protein CK203_059562 [Vitis vinifera]|uniref:Retrotransposon gag domain-containing protein n=1 Tax=Vitis vinifera TaxID=29760 RepID=A0A438FRP8_VITVI|nr:hypothetical protein CK203_059562 [Vitis vinifera]
MDCQPSRHVVLEDMPSDLVTPPVLPVQMPATQTLPTVSHDHAVVIPPMVTPVTVIEDPHSRMDRLEQRIRRMRDPDEMISWDDPGDVPVATLPVGFRMPDIDRYTGVGCPRIHLRLLCTVMRALGLDEAQLLTLFPLSLSGATQRWEKAAEMIERPIERDQMSMFLRSLHPRFARHLTGVPFQNFRSLVQALLDVDDGLSRGLWSDIIPSSDTEREGVVDHLRAMETSDFPPLQHRHPHPVQLYPSTHPHAVMVRPSFQFQRPQTGIPRHEQSRPHRRHQRTYSDLGCLWIELLSDSDLLMAGHRTDYCASLRHTIQDLIDSGAVSFPYRLQTLILVQICLLIPFQLSPHMQFLLLRAYTIIFWTPRALIFTRHFEHIEIRLLQLRFTMSDEIAPITLTTLYEMMVGLTRRVERIELILSGHPSSSRGAPGAAMPSLPHMASSTLVTLGASHPRPRPLQQHSSSISLATLARPPSQLRGPPVVTVPQERFRPIDDVGDTFQI